MPSITTVNWVPVGATGIPASVVDPRGSIVCLDDLGRHDHLRAGHERRHPRRRPSGHDDPAPGRRVDGPGLLRPLRPSRRSRSTSSTCRRPIRSTTSSTRSPADGITAGCGAGNYCPEAVNTRAQMAVFLLKAKLGADHAPPAATGTVFLDVPASDPFAPLDRGAVRARRDRRLRQRQLLPARTRHAGADGRLPPEDPPRLDLRPACRSREPSSSTYPRAPSRPPGSRTSTTARSREAARAPRPSTARTRPTRAARWRSF